MKEDTPITNRKADHISINLEKDVSSDLSTGLEAYRLVHNALPEISLNEVDTRLRFLGKPLSAPLMIASMTGGTMLAESLNRTFAMAAEKYGIAFGLGSQRAAIMQPDLQKSFAVRQWAPKTLVFANLGAVQLNDGWGYDECMTAVEMIEADALILHLNPLQEALQPEGDTNFENLLPKIEKICKQLPVPVIVKEVGWGISGSLAVQLESAGVSVIDVAGAGGTSWSEVEKNRLNILQDQAVASRFKSWGIPTAECLRQMQAADIKVPIISSGGLRDGLDLAKSLALGATLGAYARVFLLAAHQGQAAMNEKVESLIRELRIAMFSCGAAKLSDLGPDKITKDN